MKVKVFVLRIEMGLCVVNVPLDTVSTITLPDSYAENAIKI